MPDREKVIKGLEGIIDYFFDIYRNSTDSYKCAKAQEYSDCAIDAIALLKEQQGTIRKKQDDINMLCNEIAKLKHKLHDKRTGTWKWISDDKYRCSECANETYVDECMEEPQYLFCPYCGSKMTFAGRSVKCNEQGEGYQRVRDSA